MRGTVTQAGQQIQLYVALYFATHRVQPKDVQICLLISLKTL